MIQYLLDTNICIDILRRQQPQLRERLSSCAVGSLAISSITLAELFHGVYKSRFPEKNLQAVVHFCLPLEIAEFDGPAAEMYGRVRACREQAGTPIGPLDTLIAAHALSLECTLVTNNQGEFQRVSGLRVEDWSLAQ